MFGLPEYRGMKARHHPKPQKPRWFLREWLEKRELSQAKFCEWTGISKGRLSDLISGKERWNADHLHGFAALLDIEPWELLNRNPMAPEAHGLDSIADTVRRIPIDEQERALRAAQRMLEEFAAPPPKTEKPASTKKSA